MSAQTATANMGFQNKFSTTLTSGITASDTTIPLNTLPTPSEGFLVIEPDSSTAFEIIYYTSKTGSAVVCPSAAAGRGQDDSTAQSHSSGATVRMDTVAGMFEVLQNMTAVTPGSAGGVAFASGWTLIPNTTPNTVVANGNRSYTCTFNGTDLTSTLSAGMRLRTTRTVAAPTQCTSLNGTTQFYSKTSPAGMTFTNNFATMGWVKLTSYVDAGVISRYNGTSGWIMEILATGQVRLTGFNGGAGNSSYVQSYQSIPLNKWVHVAAQLDMATFTATTTTSYVMIDGVDVPASVTRGGTNPTALVQAGNLEVGSFNAGSSPFPGKLAQVAVFNAKVTEATIQGYISQSLAGTETSLISAYSFNNSINDLNANANNLTANGSAVATNADSPFGGQAGGSISSILDYGIITSVSFSTNTTLVVQVPEGCTIPTSGGVSAVSYATVKVPYGMPVAKGKFRVQSIYKADCLQANPSSGTWYNPSTSISLPIGDGMYGYDTDLYGTIGSNTICSSLCTISTANNSETDSELTTHSFVANTGNVEAQVKREKEISLSASATYYLNAKVDTGSMTNVGFRTSTMAGKIYWDPAHL